MAAKSSLLNSFKFYEIINFSLSLLAELILWEQYWYIGVVDTKMLIGDMHAM